MDYYIGLAVGILGCLTVEIGHAVYKSVKRSREKKRMFATISTTGTATEFTNQASKHVRFPNLSRLVKGKDKVVWCGESFWYLDWVDGYVCLEIETTTKGVTSSGKVKEDDIEALLQAQRIEAISKPLIDNAKEIIKDVKEFGEWKANKSNSRRKPTTGKGKK